MDDDLNDFVAPPMEPTSGAKAQHVGEVVYLDGKKPVIMFSGNAHRAIGDFLKTLAQVSPVAQTVFLPFDRASYPYVSEAHTLGYMNVATMPPGRYAHFKEGSSEIAILAWYKNEGLKEVKLSGEILAFPPVPADRRCEKDGRTPNLKAVPGC